MKTQSPCLAGLPLPRAVQLLAVASFLVGLAGVSTAQEPEKGVAKKKQSGLTAEVLVGDAVSLANRDYPEIDSAIQRFRNGDVQGSLDFLNQAVEKYPKLPPTDVIMAKMQLAYRNSKAALFLLERVVVSHPDDPEAFLLLADQAFVAGRTAEAEALFEMVRPKVQGFEQNSRRKKNFEIRLIAGRSAVAERRRQWEAARESLEKWIEIDPESAAAHQRLGVVLFRLKDPPQALKEFTKAREINSEGVAHPFVILGQLFSQDDDKENARKSFEKAYKQDTSDAKVAQAYAIWLIQEEDLDQAKIVANTLREQSPDSVTALLLNGVVAHMQGDRERCQQALTKVLGIDPSNETATNILALLLIESEDNADRERALRYAQVNAELYDTSVQANITLGWVLFKLDRGTEAQAALQKGARAGQLQLQPDSAYLVANIMSKQEGSIKKVSQMLEQVLKQKKGIFLFRRDAEKLLAELKAGDQKPPTKE
jgi:tetratricopeptide (TPR) repeat protein